MITSDRRGVRFDVYAKDDRSVIYDIDMQNAMMENLPKRTRYIQSLIDLDQMERGAHFSELTKSYVIFICNFNLKPAEGRHKYTFCNLCKEDSKISLEDGTEKVFLCTKGNLDDISPELKQLLAYVSGEAPDGDFSKRLDIAVKGARMNPQWRKEYMDLQDYVDEAREEGRAEGRKEGRAEGRKEGRAEGITEGEAIGEKRLADLVSALIANGESDKVARAVSDKEYRDSLYKQYAIV